MEETSAFDYSDSVSKVEGIEQNVIQHIRTSGIRKPRETQLIDEMMDLRRERRKLLSSLVQQIKSIDAVNQQLTEELRICKEKLSTESGQLQGQLSSLLSQKQHENERFDEKLRRELEIQEEKLRFMEKINIEKLKNKYAERMKFLESKVDEVSQMKAVGDQKEAKAIAMELVAKAKLEMEKKCMDKISEYKQSIVAISSREMDLEGSVARYRQLVATYDEENSILKKKISSLEADAAARSLREKDLELTNCALLAKTKTFDEMEQNLANIGSKYELEKQTLLAQKDAEHAQHLVQVDERIRKMLAAKDLELSNIRGILRAKETKLKASEEALAQINREIVSIKKR